MGEDLAKTGFFGKIPTSGDFVTRNLMPGTRPILDRWLTQNLASYAKQPDIWPKSGIRGLLVTGKVSHAVLVIPSHDISGRAFPLAFVVPCTFADRRGIDHWAEAVLTNSGDANSADELARVLSKIRAPSPTEVPLDASRFWDKDIVENVTELFISS